MCRASGVSAEIDVDRIPLSGTARTFLNADSGLLSGMLTGGDDYEVLFTLAPDRVVAMREAAEGAGVAVTEIGRITEGADAPRFVGEDGEALQFGQTSFSHF
jgi:thiamine-monophosphate kinase